MHSIVFHAHQKLDRAASRHLQPLLPGDASFPHIRQVLKFEAGHGPDSAKLKRLPNGQPWHFVDPHDSNDTDLHDQIDHHYQNLVKALRQEDEVRAAFEAAWLAHALVDGLTPAHHFPYETELAALRGGECRHTRKGLLGRLYVKGDNLGQSILHSLKLVGPKGLLTTHAMFEIGAYTIIAPLRFKRAIPTAKDIENVQTHGVVEMFKSTAKEIAELDIYKRFYQVGWTRQIGDDVRYELAPRMVKMVTLAWYSACYEAARPAA